MKSYENDYKIKKLFIIMDRTSKRMYNRYIYAIEELINNLNSKVK